MAENEGELFDSREGFQNWLENQNEESVAEYVAVLGHRAAMRALPLFGTRGVEDKGTEYKKFIIQIMRNNITARVGCYFGWEEISTLADKIVSMSPPKLVINNIFVLAFIRRRTPVEISIKNYYLTLQESLNSARASLIIHSDSAPFSQLIYSVDSVVFAANAASATFGLFGYVAFWKAVSDDAKKLENGMDAQDLLESKLWDSPISTLYEIFISAEGIEKIFDVLSNDKEYWGVWKQWYIPLQSGGQSFGLSRNVSSQIERRIAFGDDREDFWDRDPAEINAEIASWVDEARRKLAEADPIDPPLLPPEVSPAQDTDAIVMGVNALGQVDRMPTPPEQRLLDTPAQRQDYRAARQDALDLQAWGVNRLGPRLAPQIDDLLAAMPEDLAQGAVFDLWRGLNRLRRTHNAHVAVGDAEGDDARLDPAAAEELGHLLDGLNNFAFGDPRLRERDQRRIAPQDRAALEHELRLGEGIVGDALENEEIVAEAAREAVAAEIANAADAGDSEHGKQAVEQAVKTKRNFIAALISAASRVTAAIASGTVRVGKFIVTEYGKGVLAALGAAGVSDAAGLTTVYKSLLEFVIRHAEPLKQYAIQVFQNPKIVELIDWIVKVFSLGA